MMFVLTEKVVFGRYDVMLLPKSKRDNAIILEFKVREPDSEKTLEEYCGICTRSDNREKIRMQSFWDWGLHRSGSGIMGLRLRGRKF